MSNVPAHATALLRCMQCGHHADQHVPGSGLCGTEDCQCECFVGPDGAQVHPMYMALTKREHAVVILTALMAGRTRIAIEDARAAGAAHGISARTMYRAKVELGLVEIHNGPFGAFWQAP